MLVLVIYQRLGGRVACMLTSSSLTCQRYGDANKEAGGVTPYTMSPWPNALVTVIPWPLLGWHERNQLQGSHRKTGLDSCA
jgi:hypothetical protein